MVEKKHPAIATLRILFILSELNFLLVLLVPTFYIDLIFGAEVQWGFQYPLSFLGDLDLLAASSMAALWKGIFGIFYFMFLLYALVGLFGDLLAKKKNVDELIKENNELSAKNLYTSVRFRFILIALYFVFSAALCFFEINQKSFSPVIPLGFIPTISALILFIIARNKKIEVFENEQAWTSARENPVLLLSQQLELFSKYKAMSRDGVFTEEEFAQKKKEIAQAISEIHLTCVPIQEKQRIELLDHLGALSEDSILSAEQLSRIKNWVFNL